MTVDPHIEQQQAAWLDQYRLFATLYFDNKPYRPAYILEYHDDIGAMISTNAVQLPEQASMMIDTMSRCSRYVDDCRAWGSGEYFTINTKFTIFSLASVLESGYPRDAWGKFRSNAAGNCAGRIDNMGPHEREYAAYAGMIVSLMDDCRVFFDEFASTEDIIFMTRDMLLAFWD